MAKPSNSIPQWMKRIGWCVGALCALYLLLLIPDHEPPVQQTHQTRPFAWNRDPYWLSLEQQFAQARSLSCDDVKADIAFQISELDRLRSSLLSDTPAPDAPVFSRIEHFLFSLATLIPVCPSQFPQFVQCFGSIRATVKRQSVHWDMNSPTARDRIYRLLYGGRTAVEEVLLQCPRGAATDVIRENDEPSATPSATILGVTIHSGDILISRGGAPTSALIARGNDYPGNFSHAALVYIDDRTDSVSIIESHIERGVAIASVAEYLRDTKLRVMVLRIRSDLPAMQSDSMLPHKAALYIFDMATEGHIPYDFEMNTSDVSRLFCSEVVSLAYQHEGVNLWSGVSHISSPGVRSWLGAFGVRNFSTIEPSDLEYDPQVVVVAEWRDFDTLIKDRMDNAVVDVMLEGADRGDRLEYSWYLLPVARALKLYSASLNVVQKVGPVPEGMTATAALRNKWYSQRHRETVGSLQVLASEFAANHGYSPPYWELVKLAEQADESNTDKDVP